MCELDIQKVDITIQSENDDKLERQTLRFINTISNASLTIWLRPLLSWATAPKRFKTALKTFKSTYIQGCGPSCCFSLLHLNQLTCLQVPKEMLSKLKSSSSVLKSISIPRSSEASWDTSKGSLVCILISLITIFSNSHSLKLLNRIKGF